MAMKKDEVCEWIQCYIDTEMIAGQYIIVRENLPESLYERLAGVIENCFENGGDSLDLFLNHFQNDEELENWMCEVDNIFSVGETQPFENFHENLKEKLKSKAS